MIKANYFRDNEDLQLQFEKLVDWPAVVETYEQDFADHRAYLKNSDQRLALAPSSVAEAVEYYRTILDNYGDIAGNEISQIAADIDRKGLTFRDGKVTHPEEMVAIIRKFQDAGLAPGGFRRIYGGLGLPNVMKALSSEIAYRADTSTTIAMASMNLASVLEKYADREMCERWIPKIIEENYSVTMGLSEPDFGSDLPNIRTRAEFSNGKWLITGTKRFQTMACGLNGGPSLILCLARTGPVDGGAKGLSFFLVEGKYAEVTGIEKKLGLKASATCEVAFDKSPAELIGKEGYGLVKYVIGMLNGARMSVAAQGTGMATGALKEAGKYARERIQFKKPLSEIPAVRRMLSRLERETAAMRSLMIHSAFSVDGYHWKAERQKEQGIPEKQIRSDETIAHWEKLANTLTPISKYYNSETANSLIYDGLQILGGSGYIEDYDLARLYRDVRISNIYDGTTQIQVNAAIGGVISGMTGNGFLRDHFEGLMKKIGVSPELNRVYGMFDEVCNLYRGLEPQGRKEEYSFEPVESAARFFNGLMLETECARLSGEERKRREQLTADYQRDSIGILSRNEAVMKSL